MNKSDKLWVIRINDVYLKHPSGPQVTKKPEEAYGCHYKDTALKYLEEFAYLANDGGKNAKVDLEVLRRGLAKRL